MATIKRGHYGLLDANIKLGILKELVNQAFETDVFRDKIDEHINQRRALGATRREEALEAARKGREVKEQLKIQNGHFSECVKSNMHESSQNNYDGENGEIAEKSIAEIIASQQNNLL